MPITIGFVPYPPGQGGAKKSINNAPYVQPPQEHITQKSLAIVLQAVPSLPNSVIISALTGSGITVTWNGAPTGTSYIVTVYSSSSSLMTSPTQVIQSTVSASGQTISFSPTDSLYYGVSVQARNQNGLSRVTAITAGSLYIAPPVAPTSITLSSLSGIGATVTWSGGSGATSYTCQIYYNSSSSVTTSNSQVSQSPYSSVTSGSTFTFTPTDITYYAATVTAINVGGQATSSISSAVQYFAPPGQPTVNTPTNTSTTLNMSWSAPASGGSSVTSYTVYVLANGSAAPSGTLSPGNVTSTTFSPMVSGTPYSFYVVANGNGGSGTQSSTSSTVTYTAPPGAPSAISLSSFTASSVVLSWTAGSGATSHNIVIYSSATSNMASPTAVNTTTGATSGSTFTLSLTGGLYYGAIVTAVNSAGSTASTISTGVQYSSAPGGSYWIAVGIKSGVAFMAYNTNATPTGAWTQITLPSLFGGAVYSIAYNSTTGLFVAGGVSGFAYSYNLVNWTSITSATFTQVFYITFAATYFVAVGAGTDKLAYSTSGTSWTGTGSTVFTTSGRKVQYSSGSSTRWLAVGIGGSSVVSASAIPTSWGTVTSSTLLTTGLSLTHDAGYSWLAVGQGSTVGVTFLWNAAVCQANTATGYGSSLNIVASAFGSSTYVIATNAGTIYYTASSGFVSPNGTSTTWTANGSGTTFFSGNSINCIENNGTVFLAGAGVQGGAVMAYSTNGSSWTLVTSVNAQSPTAIYGVYWKA